MTEAIQTELSESGVLFIRLNRPEVLNSMNRDLVMGLLETMNEVNEDPKVRVVVITGNGRGFCAGAGKRGHRDHRSLSGDGRRKPREIRCMARTDRTIA